eukprot:jgi/Tetstr1/464142/TSEL_008947.t1
MTRTKCGSSDRLSPQARAARAWDQRAGLVADEVLRLMLGDAAYAAHLLYGISRGKDGLKTALLLAKRHGVNTDGVKSMLAEKQLLVDPRSSFRPFRSERALAETAVACAYLRKHRAALAVGYALDRGRTEMLEVLLGHPSYRAAVSDIGGRRAARRVVLKSRAEDTPRGLVALARAGLVTKEYLMSSNMQWIYVIRELRAANIRDVVECEMRGVQELMESEGI